MSSAILPPGFRFHPTDVELIMFYLKRKVTGKKFPVEAKHAITELNICHYSPWELPGQSRLKSKDREWYFYCPRERKYSSGSRAKRATKTGFWKATGNDRVINYDGRMVGMIKTLVFYEGVAPKGKRTNWVIHEYRMEDKHLADAGVSQDTFTICKLFEKAGSGPKNGSQYGVFREEDWEEDEEVCLEKDFSSVSPAIVAPTGCQRCHALSTTVELGCTSTKFTLDQPGPSYPQHGISLSELNANQVLPDSAIFSHPIEISAKENVTSEQGRGEGAEQCNNGDDMWMDELGDLSELLAGVGDLGDEFFDDNGSWAAAPPAEQPPSTPLQPAGLDLSDLLFFDMYDESALIGELEKAAAQAREEQPPGSLWASADDDRPPPPHPPPPLPHPYHIWDPSVNHHHLPHPVFPEMSTTKEANYMELDDLAGPVVPDSNCAATASASQSQTLPPPPT